MFEISCLKIVEGNVAILGGTVRSTNQPNLVDAAFFAVEDNGEPGKNADLLSPVFFNDGDPTANPGNPQSCQDLLPENFGMFPIESGNIFVRSGTTRQ